jgi:hypothetical protein
MDEKPKRSANYLAAQQMLPPELHPLLDQLVEEYKFAALKHTRQRFANALVLAELILMGWRSPPIDTNANRDSSAGLSTNAKRDL